MNFKTHHALVLARDVAIETNTILAANTSHQQQSALDSDAIIMAPVCAKTIAYSARGIAADSRVEEHWHHQQESSTADCQHCAADKRHAFVQQQQRECATETVSPVCSISAREAKRVQIQRAKSPSITFSEPQHVITPPTLCSGLSKVPWIASSPLSVTNARASTPSGNTHRVLQASKHHPPNVHFLKKLNYAPDSCLVESLVCRLTFLFNDNPCHSHRLSSSERKRVAAPATPDTTAAPSLQDAPPSGPTSRH